MKRENPLGGLLPTPKTASLDGTNAMKGHFVNGVNNYAAYAREGILIRTFMCEMILMELF